MSPLGIDGLALSYQKAVFLDNQGRNRLIASCRIDISDVNEIKSNSATYYS